MMLAYELHKPRPEEDPKDLRHEVILKAVNPDDVMRLLAVMSIFHQGCLDDALDLMIMRLATEELPHAFENAAANQGPSAGVQGEAHPGGGPAAEGS